MAKLVEVKKVSKNFNELKAVSNISFDIESGEVVSILGESGSGKSTLLRLLAGLEDADTGDIEIAGETITGPADNLVPGYDFISLVYQDFQLERFKTIKDNIASVIYYMDESSRNRRVNQLIKLCRLKEKADNFPNELSGGQQQRVAIAIALAKDPEVVLMDEPFSNLDSRLKNMIRDEVVDILRSSGVIVIMVSHDHTDAMSVADRIMVMRKGRLLQVGTPEEIYYHPKNEYIANFLGPANQILLNGNESKALFRPEKIKIKSEGAYSGVVTRSVFQGLHYHIFLKSEISKKDVLTYHDHEIEKGAMVTFDIQ